MIAILNSTRTIYACHIFWHSSRNHSHVTLGRFIFIVSSKQKSQNWADQKFQMYSPYEYKQIWYRWKSISGLWNPKDNIFIWIRPRTSKTIRIWEIKGISRVQSKNLQKKLCIRLIDDPQDKILSIELRMLKIN